MRTRWIGLAVLLGVAVLAALVALARPWETSAPDGSSDGSDAVPGSESRGALAAHKAAAAAPAPQALGRASIVGEVRRRGQGVAAWIELFRLGDVDPAMPPTWSQGPDDFAPPLGRPIATTTSAADGTFSFDAVSLGVYAVLASDPDGTRAAARVRLDVEGRRAFATLDLRGGRERLTGRAVRRDGSAFLGEVAALPAAEAYDDGARLALRYARTAKDGQFTLDGLEAGRVVVIAREQRRGGGARLVSTSAEVTLPRREPFVFTVDAGLGALEGRVVADADGSPVAGGSVVATSWGTLVRGTSEAYAQTEADGRFTLETAPGTRTKIVVRAAGFASAKQPAPDPLTPIEVRLARTGRVTGRVTSAVDGVPVAGVDVYAFPTSGDARDGAHTTTDAAGRYALADVSPGERTIFAMGHGWMSKSLDAASPRGWNPLAVDVMPAASVERDLVVVPAGRVVGRVLDPDGKPVRGAVVQWETPEEPGSAPSNSAFVLHLDVASGEDGGFVFDEVPAGLVVEVEATAPGFSPGRSTTTVATAASAGSAAAAVEVRLAAPRHVVVRVEDAEAHAPIPGARVRVQSARRVGHTTYHEPIASGATAADGLARIGPLPNADLYAEVDASGYVDHGESILADAAASGPVVVRLRRWQRIVVRVQYADGTPALASVRASSANGSASGTLDGDWEFATSEPGTYRVEITPFGGDPIVREVKTGGEPVEIVIPGTRPAPRVVEVLDGDGKPVASATLWVTSGPGDIGTYEVAGGRASLLPSRAEGYFEVLDVRTAGGVKAPWGAAYVGPVAGDTARVTIRLSPERTIDGTVVGPDEVPVAFAGVSATPTRPAGLSSVTAPHDAARTDEAGHFHLRGLWEGDYRLSVEAPSEFQSLADATAAKSGASGVRIALRATSIVAPKVLDADGRPVVGAEVGLRDPADFQERIVRTDRDGVARLVGLDPARPLILWVSGPDGSDSMLPLAIHEWKPSSEPLRLARAFTVRGVVRDRAGRSVPGAQVLAAQPSRQQDATSDAGGRFVVHSLGEGEASLVAWTASPAAARSKVVRAVAGAEDVALVLAPPATLVVKIDGVPAGAGSTQMSASLSDAAADVSHLRASVTPDGEVRFEGLDPDATYAFAATYPAGSDVEAVALRRGVRAADREIRVRLEPPQKIAGRVVLPEGAKGSVRIKEAGLYRSMRVETDGRFELAGLPEGRFTVVASATAADGSRLEGRMEAQTGEQVEIPLTPAK